MSYTKPVKKRKSVHYVNNSDFFDALYAYHQTDKTGKVPRYIADCILQICRKLSLKRNFIAYSFRDDMISEAILDCTKAIPKFDPTRETRVGRPNPFAYFTEIARRAFIRIIEEEKKENYIKHSNMRNLFMEDEVNAFELYDAKTNSDYNDTVIENYENTMKSRLDKKTAKIKADAALKGIEGFM